MNRRSLITGLVSLIAAPAIVRASSLMQVRSLPLSFLDDEGTRCFVGDTLFSSGRAFLVEEISREFTIPTRLLVSMRAHEGLARLSFEAETC